MAIQSKICNTDTITMTIFVVNSLYLQIIWMTSATGILIPNKQYKPFMNEYFWAVWHSQTETTSTRYRLQETLAVFVLPKHTSSALSCKDCLILWLHEQSEVNAAGNALWRLLMAALTMGGHMTQTSGLIG